MHCMHLRSYLVKQTSYNLSKQLFKPWIMCQCLHSLSFHQLCSSRLKQVRTLYRLSVSLYPNNTLSDWRHKVCKDLAHPNLEMKQCQLVYQMLMHGCRLMNKFTGSHNASLMLLSQQLLMFFLLDLKTFIIMSMFYQFSNSWVPETQLIISLRYVKYMRWPKQCRYPAHILLHILVLGFFYSLSFLVPSKGSVNATSCNDI